METYNRPVKDLWLWSPIFSNVNYCIMSIKTWSENNHFTHLFSLSVSSCSTKELKAFSCFSSYHFPELFPLFPFPFYNFHLYNDILGDPPLHF